MSCLRNPLADDPRFSGVTATMALLSPLPALTLAIAKRLLLLSQWAFNRWKPGLEHGERGHTSLALPPRLPQLKMNGADGRLSPDRVAPRASYFLFITDLAYWAQGRTRSVREAVRCGSTATIIPRRGFALPTQLVFGEKKAEFCFRPSKFTSLAFVVSSYATGSWLPVAIGPLICYPMQ